VARTANLLTVAFTLASATMAAAIVHLVPYLVDHGWTPLVAAVAAGTLGATQVAARIAFGPAARRASPPILTASILGLPAAGALALAASGGSSLAWLAVILLGVAQGSATLLRPMLLARLHGPEGYGRLAATSAATTTIARATAPLALAVIAASVGYETGLVVFSLAALGAAALAHHAVAGRGRSPPTARWTRRPRFPPSARRRRTAPSGAGVTLQHRELEHGGLPGHEGVRQARDRTCTGHLPAVRGRAAAWRSRS
jgi:MFS family permease